MLSKYLPSKKIVALLILPIMSIAFLFLWNYYLKNKDIFVKKDNLADTVSILNRAVDTDGDGLQDWEEDLVGTDKNKKDTDGDGFSDNLEIKTGSDPLDPLNKEKKKQQVIENIDSVNYDYRFDLTLTNTDRAAVQFLEEGVKLKEAGISFNKDAQKRIVEKIISENRIGVDLTRFKLKDLKIENKKLDIFKKELTNILADLKNEELVEEIVLLNQFLETKSNVYIKKLEENVLIHERYLQRLLKLPVPKEVSLDYLKYLNAYSSEIEILSFYSKIGVDPVSLIQALGVYKEIDSVFFRALLNLANRLR